MMALSTMINDRAQTPSAYWKFELSPSFRPSPNINYIRVPTTVEFKKKIISLIQTLSFHPCQSVLVQYWAAKQTGNSIVLTTTCQPCGLWGNNIEELQIYHKGCLDHKLYVHPKEGVAFGLSGRVFLNRIPEQTQNVHRYPKDQRPPCDDAIFTKIWGSFAVPLIVNDECFGVLEFVLDKGNVPYDDDIGLVCSALKDAGFQYSFRTDLRIRTYINARKRSRTTSSTDFTRYFRLVPYFGLSSADAAIKLKETTVKLVEPITPGTFRNACRNVGIPEWPWISNRSTTTRASIVPETQVNPSTAETISFATLMAPEYSSFGLPANSDFMASNTSYFGATIAAEYSSFRTPIASQYNSFGAPIDTRCGSFGAPIVSEYSSFFGEPVASEYSSFGAPMASEYVACETSSIGSLTATDHISAHSSSIPIGDDGICEWSYTHNTNTTDASHITHDASSVANSYATEYMESDATSFWTPFTTENNGFYECSSIKTMTAGASLPETLTNQSASDAGCIEPLIESQHASDDIMQDSNGMKDLDMKDKFTHMLFDFQNWASQNNIPDYY